MSMDAPARIRQATPADIPALLGLLDLLFGIEKDFVFDAAKQERGLRLLLASSTAAVRVAEQDGGQVIGMCSGQLVISTAEGGPSVWVEDVAVLSTWQGRGVGRLLVAAMGEWAVSQGARRIQLLADRDNASALRFYQKAGFHATAMICLRRMS